MRAAAERAAAGAPCPRPRWAVAEVVRRHGEAYRSTHPVSGTQQRVLRDLAQCRTAALGGHLERCGACGFERPAYNSCRNRHCPTCQAVATARWLAARRSELLPVAYFHAVFTLPHELNPLVLANPRSLVGLLFHAVAETLAAFGQRELGGTMGFVAVLHTWDQQLRPHVHLHCLIPGGALAADPDRWVPSPPRFLFRVEPLAQVFRGKYLAGLRKLDAQGALVHPGGSARRGPPADLPRLVDALFRKNWVVYCKPPFTGPETVLDYLARYTHRVAIGNHRIREVGEDHVTFTYRDRARGDVVRTARLPADEFLRRFLRHVLPDGLQRIRHYGFLSNRAKKDALPRCRALLADPIPAPTPAPTPASAAAAILALTGIDVRRCPSCGAAALARVAVLLPVRPAPGSAPLIRAPPVAPGGGR